MLNGVARGYYVSIPSTYESIEPQRLVFGYHGSGWNGEMMRGYLDMERAPLVSRSVFVYPDGIDGVWDLSQAGDDMLFFDAIVARMSVDYCVDRSRIFVSGQSFGGMMSNAVGCARGDVVRAIAPIAGSGPHTSSACKGPVAAWIVHGMDDLNVSFASGEKSRDCWAMKNGCSMNMAAVMPTGCQAYQGCSAGQPVICCTHVNETGHQEPESRTGRAPRSASFSRASDRSDS
jgi:poly(3-hydroxybutyrate) depolymerase